MYVKVLKNHPPNCINMLCTVRNYRLPRFQFNPPRIDFKIYKKAQTNQL